MGGIAGTKVKFLLEANPQLFALKVDFRNGFNAVRRHHMLTAAYGTADLAPLWPLIDTLYGEDGPLWLKHRGDVISTIWSEEGSRQGCVLGSLLFCTAEQELIAQLR